MGRFKEMKYLEIMNGKERRLPAHMSCQDLPVLLECIDMGRAEVHLIEILKASVQKAMQTLRTEDDGEPDPAKEGSGGGEAGSSDAKADSHVESSSTSIAAQVAKLGQLFDTLIAEQSSSGAALNEGPESPSLSRDQVFAGMLKHGYTAGHVSALLQVLDATGKSESKRGPQQISRVVFVESSLIAKAREAEQASSQTPEVSPAATAQEGYMLKMRRYQSIDEDLNIRADFVEMLVKLEERDSGITLSEQETQTMKRGKELLGAMDKLGKDSTAIATHAFAQPFTENIDVETESDRILYYECSLEQIQDLTEKYQWTVQDDVILEDDPFNVAADTNFMVKGIPRFPHNFGPDLAKLLAPTIINNTNIKNVTVCGHALDLELFRRGNEEVDLSFKTLEQAKKGTSGLKPYSLVYSIFLAECLRTFGARIVILDLRGHQISAEGLQLWADAVPSMARLRRLNGFELSEKKIQVKEQGSHHHLRRAINLRDFLSDSDAYGKRSEFERKPGEWLDLLQIVNNISDLVFADDWDTLNLMEQAFVCMQIRLHNITCVDGFYIRHGDKMLAPSLPAGRRRIHIILIAAVCAFSPGITGLNLDSTGVGETEMEELARDSSQLRHITTLSLRSNPLRARGLFLLHPAIM